MPASIIIPARRKSTRLPDKLLLAETGKSLLVHTIDRVLEAYELDPVLIAQIAVAVDDEELAEVARRTGVHVIMTSTACKSGTDRIVEALPDIDQDIVVNVQADEPEIAPETILKAARILDQCNNQVGTLATLIEDFDKINDSSIVKVVCNAIGDALYFSRSPIPYNRQSGKCISTLHHLGIYTYRRDFLENYKDLPNSDLEQIEQLEQLRILDVGYRIRVELVDGAFPGIDTRENYDSFVRRSRL